MSASKSFGKPSDPILPARSLGLTKHITIPFAMMEYSVRHGECQQAERSASDLGSRDERDLGNEPGRGP